MPGRTEDNTDTRGRKGKRENTVSMQRKERLEALGSDFTRQLKNSKKKKMSFSCSFPNQDPGTRLRSQTANLGCQTAVFSSRVPILL